MSMHQRTGFGENAWFQDNLLAFSFLWQPFNMIDPLIALSRDWLEAYREMVTPLSLVNRKGEPMEIQFLSRTDVVWAQRLFTPCWLCENQRSKSTDKSNCCCFSKTEGQLADMYCMWFNDGYRQDVIDTIRQGVHNQELKDNVCLLDDCLKCIIPLIPCWLAKEKIICVHF